MRKRLVALALSLGLILGMSAQTPVFAADAVNETTETGKQGTNVSIVLEDGAEYREDEFYVSIPKNLSASINSEVLYTVTVSGFLNEGKTLSVTPSSSLTLKPSATDTQNANITLTSRVVQTKTVWSPSDLTITGGTSALGRISPVVFNTTSSPGEAPENEPTSIEELSGEFTGTLVFTIVVE